MEIARLRLAKWALCAKLTSSSINQFVRLSWKLPQPSPELAWMGGQNAEWGDDRPLQRPSGIA